MSITTSMTSILLAVFLLFSTCSSSEIKVLDVENATTIQPKKVLVVYLSRTNNTKAIAEIIHKQVGGTLVALELENPYSKNYKQLLTKWQMRMLQASYLL